MEVLYFEPTDEVTRAIERVRGSKDDSVALVLPQNSLILQSIVNLKLIKRISQQGGKQIALVTTDQIGRNLAGQIGLTVYGKIEDGKPVGRVLTKTPEPVTSGAVRDKILQETEEITTVTGIQVHRYDKHDPLVQLGATEEPATGPTPEITDLAELGQEAVTPPVEPPRSLKPKGRPRRRKILITLVVLILGWWYFTYNLSTTRILLTVKGQSASVDTEVTAVGSPGQDQVKLYVYTSEQSGNKEVPTTGSKDLGNKAKGTVSLVNTYSSTSQSIPAGATLTINSQSFKLTQAVVIPGAEFAVEGTTISVKKPGRVDGSIEASAAGESFNINGGRMTIVGVTAERDSKVYGENPTTSGGTTVIRKVVAETDLETLKSVLVADLVAKGNEDIAKQAPSDLMPIGELGKSETITYETSATAGTEADKVTAIAKVSLRLAGVTKSDLAKFANTTATVNRPNQAFTASQDPVISVLTSDPTAMLAKLKLNVEGTISAKLDTEILKKQVVGKVESDATQILSQVPLYSKVEFRYAPSFMDGRVSRRANRVSVEVLYE
jgi:hypothetical protein